MESPGVASLRLRGRFSDFASVALTGKAEARAAALAASSIDALELRLVNAGAFEKIVTHAAKDKNKTPTQLLAEWKAASGALLPALAGGDLVGAAAADAIGKFLDNPKSLTVALKGKAGPVKVVDAGRTETCGPLARWTSRSLPKEGRRLRRRQRLSRREWRRRRNPLQRQQN
ncbi:MAG: hypothetical protein H6871_08135 [Methylobacteriaceae bacterium]|nr:hypothetical protein [Methylobacteriaceae bacterium]